MKLQVITPVNERIGKPSLSAHTFRSMSPGEWVEVDHVAWGEDTANNSLWYVSRDGLRFYWSGAFKETNFQLNNTILEDFPAKQQFGILLQLKSAAREILKNTISYYIGCGIGQKNYDPNGPLSLIVYVMKKEPASRLKEMLVRRVLYCGISIRTDVIEMGRPMHHDYIQYSAAFLNSLIPNNPTRIGEGILSPKELGTLSLRAFKKNAAGQTEPFALSCFHVLCDSLLNQQPAIKSYDGSGGLQSRFPSATSQVFPVAEGEYSNDFDYAAVKLATEFDLSNKIETVTVTDFFHFDEMPQLTNPSATVKMIGKTSYIQTGLVRTITDITLPPIPMDFFNVIVCDKISMPGDSGAPVIEVNSGKLVGFIIGGDEQTASYIIPFYNLFNNRNYFLQNPTA
jgi:hypothetical protein